MKLSVKFLKNVYDVNGFQYSDQWDISEGSSQKLYFQVIDKLKEDLRYMSEADSFSFEVTFLSIDDDSEITKTATQPFSIDNSIFLIELDANEVPNSGAVKFKLTETTGGNSTEVQFKVEQAIVVDLLSNGGC